MTQMYCQNCGSVGLPTTRVKGSFGVEVVLWLLMILPGLLYSVWRLTTKEQVCPKCGAPHMIPVDSPKARAAGAVPLSPADLHAVHLPALDDAAMAAHAERGRRFIGVSVLVIAGLAVLGFLVNPRQPTTYRPTAAQPEAMPRSLTAALIGFGKPDTDDSTQYDTPRPPMVTRILTYRSKRVRLIYTPDAQMGAPPPYQDWIFVGATDPTAETKLSGTEAVTRLRGR